MVLACINCVSMYIMSLVLIVSATRISVFYYCVIISDSDDASYKLSKWIDLGVLVIRNKVHLNDSKTEYLVIGNASSRKHTDNLNILRTSSVYGMEDFLYVSLELQIYQGYVYLPRNSWIK